MQIGKTPATALTAPGHGPTWREVDMVDASCSADDCSRPSFAREMCRLHYRRWWRSTRPTCGEPGCTSIAVAPPFCQRHRAGHPRPPRSSECSEEWCSRPRNCRGWCELHYTRWRVHGDAMAAPASRANPICSVCGDLKRTSPSGKPGWCGRCTQERKKKRDPEKVRQARLAWARRNPDKVTAHNMQRRAMRREATCDHGEQCVTDAFVCGLRRQPCRYCGGRMEHVDHFVPLSRGGAHCRLNLVPACARCNCSKGNKMPAEWPALVDDQERREAEQDGG